MDAVSDWRTIVGGSELNKNRYQQESQMIQNVNHWFITSLVVTGLAMFGYGMLDLYFQNLVKEPGFYRGRPTPEVVRDENESEPDSHDVYDR